MKNNYRIEPAHLSVVLLMFIFCLSFTPASAATHTVTNCADSGGGSLRQAITDANADGDAAPVINFNITIANAGYSTGEGGSGVVTNEAGSNKWFRIIVNDPGLPAIAHSQVYINGFSQTTSEANNTLGPEIEIRKSLTAVLTDYSGLSLAGGISSCTIEGLVINGFEGSYRGAIRGETSNDYNRIIGCYLGTSASGEAAWPNSMGVILRNYCDHNIIGGSTAAERNIISGNISYGVWLQYSECTSNEIKGNYIGLSASGAPLENSGGGIRFEYPGPGNVIGGDSASDRNYISSNGSDGIYINQSDYVTIKNNYIGIGIDGSTERGNVGDGIETTSGVDYLTIEDNVISGNSNHGIRFTENGNHHVYIKGNKIGTSADGLADKGNKNYGILLVTAGNNYYIGGATTPEGNIVSGNDYSGLSLSSISTSEIKNNIIGLSQSGAALGNSWIGMEMSGYDNIIGGSNTAEANIISKSGLYGLAIGGAASSRNRVAYNYIGTGFNGVGDMGNGNDGIYLSSGTTYNTIEGNVISGNDYNGIKILSSNSNEAYGNYIGLSLVGDALPNSGSGINIELSQHCIIGGATTFEANYISSNTADGIYLNNADDTIVKNNIIGLGLDGVTDRGNGSDGIELGTGSDNVIITGNIISGNNNGVVAGIRSSSSHYAVVTGNKIGTNVSGTSAVPNRDGIKLDASNFMLIGGTLEAERNIICGNSNVGVAVTNSSSNEVKGNYIGLTAGGAALQNGWGIWFSGGSSYDNVVGGDTTHEANFISSNNDDGIYIGSSGQSIINNIIGLGLDKAADRGNGDNGIEILSANDNLIKNNVISWQDGPDDYGIEINTSNLNIIIGNKIGTDITGLVAAGNYTGIHLTSALYNTIGGSNEVERNIISGNTGKGIYFNDASNNEILGNYIGTDLNGESPLPNNVGIYVYNDSDSNIIGGPGSGQRNLISGNYTEGVYVYWNCDNNEIKSNWIGTKADGERSLPNSNGIRLGYTSSTTEHYNIIGGNTTAEGNVISGNTNYGIYINDCGVENEVKNNLVGLTASGEGVLPNGWAGIFVSGFYPAGSYSLSLISNEVKYNGGYGISVAGLPEDHQMLIRDCTLEANTGYSIYNNSSYLIDAQNNDWRTPMGPYDPLNNLAAGRWYNPVGEGQQVTDYVDYRYWYGWGSIVPSAPTTFTGEAASTTSINWFWDDNTTREALYYVVDSPGGDIKVTSPASSTTTTESGLLPYTEYTRKVVAWKMDASSESSSFMVETPPPETNPPTVEVVVPNGGETWRGGQSYNITFTVTDESGIKANSIDLYYTSGETWVTIDTGQPTNAAYSWLVPTINTTEAKVKVTAQDIYDQFGTDESDAVFSILTTSSVEVIYPNGGQYLKGGTVCNITFICTSDAGVKANSATFYYTSGESWVLIATGQSTEAAYPWTTPEIDTTEAKVRVTIVDVLDNPATDESDSFFAIDSTPPVVNVLSPNGGEIWAGGTTHDLTWTATDNIGFGTAPITLYYSLDNGMSYSTIAAGETNDGTYPWLVPTVNTDEAKARVFAEDLAGNTSSDESNSAFSIDSTYPAVISVTPSNGATAVLVSAEVITIFSKEMSREAAQAAFDLSASPGVVGIFSWSADSKTMTFTPSDALEYLTTYNINIAQSATDNAGHNLSAAWSSTFMTAERRDGQPPAISIYLIDRDGKATGMKNGDYIPKAPKMQARISDDRSLNRNTLKFTVDDVEYYPTVTVVDDTHLTADVGIPTNLEDESIKTHEVKVQIQDNYGNLGEKILSDLKVSYASARIVGPTLTHPMPFSPTKGGEVKIVYNLTADSDIEIFLISMDGKVVWRERLLEGSEGGRAGYNEVPYNGRSDISGGFIGNGIYMLKITCNGKVISSGKIVIFD